MRLVVSAVALAAVAACKTPTSFTGESMVVNGPAGCKVTCEGWGMELVGMVKMGEYSDGCICQVKPPPAQPSAMPPAGSQPPPEGRPAAGKPSAATIPAAAGVYMQMVAAAAAAAQQSRNMMEHPYVPHSPVGSPGWRPGLP